MEQVKMNVEYGVKTDWEKLDKWQQQANQFTVTLKYNRRQMTIPFFQGTGISNDPSVESVLDCLFADHSTVEYSDSFEGWAEQLGYDTDSRQAEKTYKQCKKQSEKLEKLLGDDFINIKEKYTV